MAGAKKQNSFARKLLKALAISASVLVAASSPYFGLNFLKGIEKEVSRKKWRQFYKSLQRLKNRKQITVSQRPDGSFEVTLTNLGKRVARGIF